MSSTDEGSYSCVAENVLGQAQQVAYLAVSGQGGGGVGWLVWVWLMWVLVNWGGVGGVMAVIS